MNGIRNMVHQVKLFFSTDEAAASSSDSSAPSPTATSTATPHHGYFELGSDLLAKPNLLADLIELETPHSFLIFCNSPSDADFVEVMLKKRGIASRKLIGNVPPFKVQQAIKDIRAGTARALIITDVAARTVDSETFDIIVNYSMPGDPELYLHRLGISGRGGTTGKIITLLGPLDLTNFLYLKKFVDFEFHLLTPPAAESLALAQVKGLALRAQEIPAAAEERIQAVVQGILANPSRDSIIGLLLLQSMEQPRSSERESRHDDEGDEENRRPHRREQGRGRREYDDEERGGRPDRRSRNDDQDDYAPRSERPRREYTPPKRVTRIYLGAGFRDDFSADRFKELFSSHLAEMADQVKHLSVREGYSFADVPEEIAEGFISGLSAATLPSGSSLNVKRATIVPEPRPAVMDAPSGGEERDDIGRSESGDEGFDDTGAEEERRTSVDE